MATSTSFIANVNTLTKKIGIIESANSIFDEGVIPVLNEIAALDLDLAIQDLKKGTFFGNRKIDMDLAINNNTVAEYIAEQEALALTPDATELLGLWTNAANTVYYKGATVLYTDGNLIEIVFKDQTLTSLESVASSSEVISHIEQDPAYAAYTTNTSMIQDNAGVVGQIIRTFDVVGTVSNLEKITLHVDTTKGGAAVTTNPIYYWGLTTSSFNTLAMRTADIIKLGNDIDSLIVLANRIDELLLLQDNIPQLVTNIDSLYNNIANLNIISNSITEILTVYNDIKAGGTNYINTASTDLQLGGTSKIGVAATDLLLGAASKIGITSGSINNVNSVGSNITNVNIVGPNIASVNTVAADLDLGVNSNVDIVGTNITDVNTVAGDINLGAASTVKIVSDNIADVNTAADNIVEIQSASANAATATAQAVIATSAADTATAKSNEIKNVSVGTTITGAAGTNAFVSYNPTDGEFAFVIPQGIKGDKGDSFTVNAIGLFADRSLYDAQAKGFSFLALDQSSIYFKLSATSGDWSAGSPFGKGDDGAQGVDGIGIVSTTFTSTTDISGTPGQSGATDTYTLTYSDATTDTFDVYNGIDGSVTMTKTKFTVVAETQDTFVVDYTPGFLYVYMNGILLDHTDYTATTGTEIVLGQAAITGDIIYVVAHGVFQVADHYSITQLDAGQLDTRYYTETELATDGVLDSRYFTETEITTNYYNKTEVYSQAETDIAILDRAIEMAIALG